MYHGYVEFAASLLDATLAFRIGYLKVSWTLWGEIFLGILTVFQGSFLFYSAYLNNLYIAYAAYIIDKLFYDAAITVTTYEVAMFISEDCYALVFGINTLAALRVQIILTATVIDYLKTDIRTQFKIYGCYHFFIGIAFFFVWNLQTNILSHLISFSVNRSSVRVAVLTRPKGPANGLCFG